VSDVAPVSSAVEALFDAGIAVHCLRDPTRGGLASLLCELATAAGVTIEVREDAKGKWSGDIVTGFQAAQRKLNRIRAFREAGVPRPSALRKLSVEERRRWRPIISEIEAAHPMVDRNDTDAGRFVMSLCEGEMLWMRHKKTGEEGYFVVAKLDKPQAIVLVPHWDARAAGERKDAEGKKVPHSKRDQFAATPSDLKNLAPDGQPHTRKVRVSALGEVTLLEGD